MAETFDTEQIILAIEEILDDAEDVSGPFHDVEEEDEEEEQEEYANVTLSEKVKRYQRGFRKYVESIKRELEDMGYDFRRGRGKAKTAEYSDGKELEKLPDHEAQKSPFERGHKWGCGCRGCMSFREGFLPRDIEDSSLPDKRGTLPVRIEVRGYSEKRKQESADYPCGGKLRGLFRHGFLGYTLDGIEKRNGMMNYLAV